MRFLHLGLKVPGAAGLVDYCTIVSFACTVWILTFVHCYYFFRINILLSSM